MFKEEHIEAVREWHNKFQLYPPQELSDVAEFLDLRDRLMKEEFEEYQDAGADIVERADAITDLYFLGCGSLALYMEAPSRIQNLLSTSLVEDVRFWGNLIEIMVGLEKNKMIGDKLDDLFAEVLRSNHTKADKDGNPIFREDGKLLKSDLFEEPNLRKVLFYEEN